MKKLGIILCSVMILASASFLAAGAPPGAWHQQKKLSTVEDFTSLEKGDQVAQVCTKCDTVSVTEVQFKEHAMQLCQDGRAIDCPSCKNKAVATRQGPPAKGRTLVRYVDDHGKACILYGQDLKPG